MARASLPFLPTGSEQPGIYLHKNAAASQGKRGREAEGGECLAQHRTGNARPRAQPRAPIAAGPRSQQPGKRKSSREEKNETRISTHSQITTLNKCGATQLLLPTVSPLAQSWLEIKYQLPGRLGWAASSSCIPAPALFTWNQWSWCPAIKLQPAHDVFTMFDWEIPTQIFTEHGTESVQVTDISVAIDQSVNSAALLDTLVMKGK